VKKEAVVKRTLFLAALVLPTAAAVRADSGAAPAGPEPAPTPTPVAAAAATAQDAAA
jgi:hypothetical protein